MAGAQGPRVKESVAWLVVVTNTYTYQSKFRVIAQTPELALAIAARVVEKTYDAPEEARIHSITKEGAVFL